MDGPFSGAVTLLLDVRGSANVGPRQLIAESGGDMRRLPSSAHLASWVRSPWVNYESAHAVRLLSTQCDEGLVTVG